MIPSCPHFFDSGSLRSRFIFVSSLEKQEWVVSEKEALGESGITIDTMGQDIEDLSKDLAKSAFLDEIRQEEGLAEKVPANQLERAIELVREDMKTILAGLADNAGRINDQIREIVRLSAAASARHVCERLRAEMENVLLAEENRELKSEKEGLTEECRELKIKNAQLSQENLDLKAEQDRIIEEILRYDAEIDRLKAQMESQTIEVEGLKEIIAQYKVQVEQLEKEVHTDERTKLNNLRAYHRRLREEIARSGRSQKKLGLMIFDLDKFKEVNDENGHKAGNEVLKELAKIFKGEIKERVLRETDFVARWGGDEFMILLPETDIEGALIAAHRIIKTIGQTPIEVSNRQGERIRADVGASIGISLFQGKEMDPDGDKMFASADDCLQVLKGALEDAQGKSEPHRGQVAVDRQVWTHEQIEELIRKRESEKAEAEKVHVVIEDEADVPENPQQEVVPVKPPFVKGPR